MNLGKAWIKWTGIGILIQLIIGVSGLLGAPFFLGASWINEFRPSFNESPAASLTFIGLQVILVSVGIAIFARLFSSLYPFPFVRKTAETPAEHISEQTSDGNAEKPPGVDHES